MAATNDGPHGAVTTDVFVRSLAEPPRRRIFAWVAAAQRIEVPDVLVQLTAEYSDLSIVDLGRPLEVKVVVRNVPLHQFRPANNANPPLWICPVPILGTIGLSIGETAAFRRQPYQRSPNTKSGALLRTLVASAYETRSVRVEGVSQQAQVGADGGWAGQSSTPVPELPGPPRYEQRPLRYPLDGPPLPAFAFRATVYAARVELTLVADLGRLVPDLITASAGTGVLRVGRGTAAGEGWVRVGGAHTTHAMATPLMFCPAIQSTIEDPFEAAELALRRMP